MIRADRSQWRLTPSQQGLYEAIHNRLTGIRGGHRPFLLTGDVGVGKTFLAHRLTEQSAAYYHVARDHLLDLLAHHSLSDLTPEATVRFVKTLVEQVETAYVIADGFEPLLSLWAVEQPRMLHNFFVAFSRVILDRPLLIIVQTSDQLPLDRIVRDDWWPWERRFHLELTLADKEIAADNWGLDPMRARVSASLYDFLAVKLGR